MAAIARRKTLAALGSTAAAWPFVARAQQPAMPVVGLLDPGSSTERADAVAPFRKGLAEAGFVEGQNVVLEFRWADGNYERLPTLAADLVSRRVSVIVTPGASVAAIAAKLPEGAHSTERFMCERQDARIWRPNSTIQ
jgi:putative ABC transport system substrate-binding protein